MYEFKTLASKKEPATTPKAAKGFMGSLKALTKSSRQKIKVLDKKTDSCTESQTSQSDFDGTVSSFSRRSESFLGEPSVHSVRIMAQRFEPLNLRI